MAQELVTDRVTVKDFTGEMYSAYNVKRMIKWVEKHGWKWCLHSDKDGLSIKVLSEVNGVNYYDIPKS